MPGLGLGTPTCSWRPATPGRENGRRGAAWPAPAGSFAVLGAAGFRRGATRPYAQRS